MCSWRAPQPSHRQQEFTTGIASVDGISSGSQTASVRCPDVFPGELLAGEIALEKGAVSGRCGWWLAHTRPRQEKAVAAALFSRDVGYYLPLITRKSLSRGRTRVARIALFPSYVFVYGDEEERLKVLQTNRVISVQAVTRGDELRKSLLRFANLIAMGAPLLPEARLVPGERARVRSGPFRDQEGVILRRNGKTRLLIAIDYLQQGASLEVDDCLLEAV